MSKKTLALALTIVFVFAFATSAFAVWGDSTYLDPSGIVQGSSNGTSPHGTYATTSKKCAVCHAVHNADPSGSRLLRGGGTNPCVVCHVSTNAGDIIVYKGQEAAYTTASQYAHNNDCGNCHSVHGVGNTVNAITGTVTGTLNLKGLSSLAFTSASIDDPTYSKATWGAYSIATNGAGTFTLTQWCSSCHPYFQTNLNGPSHIMTTSAGNLTDYATTSGSMQVAWTNTDVCTDCHDSDTAALAARSGAAVLSVANFPHYTDGARFLETSGAVAVADGQAGLDGVCLKCHVSGAAGVGKTY